MTPTARVRRPRPKDARDEQREVERGPPAHDVGAQPPEEAADTQPHEEGARRKPHRLLRDVELLRQRGEGERNALAVLSVQAPKL